MNQKNQVMYYYVMSCQSIGMLQVPRVVNILWDQRPSIVVDGVLGADSDANLLYPPAARDH